MEREQQEKLQLLGFFGIYKKSYTIIHSWKEIFIQITLTLILPLSFIFLTQINFSKLLYANGMTSSPWLLFHFTLLFILSPLTASAVVHTTASIITAEDVTFKRVMSVWERLFSTFFNYLVIFLSYTSITIVLLLLFLEELGPEFETYVIVFTSILYFIGFVYLTVVWQLATVVTVLEDSYSGFEAMEKSHELMKGKMVLSIFTLFTPTVCLFSIVALFLMKRNTSTVENTVFGVLCFLLLSCLFLFMLVMQTVFYFVCKSYHNEIVDTSDIEDKPEKHQVVRVIEDLNNLQQKQHPLSEWLIIQLR